MDKGNIARLHLNLHRRFHQSIARHLKFLNGDDNAKRDILTRLGQNLVMVDGKLNFEAKKWYAPIGDNYLELQAKYLKARLSKAAICE